VKRLEIDFVESFDKDSITDELRRIARVLGSRPYPSVRLTFMDV
jgi:hypothetical protein